PRRLAPLRARPAPGVSVGKQQSHYCDTEQNKTDRTHGSSPSPSFRSDLRCRNGIVCEFSEQSKLFPACSPGTMADIFISYSKADHALALKLSAFLEAEGWSVWWDKSLGAADL